MAELASGAVTSLLGVIRNETRLLGGVQGDVQFIKEEMESMNSFLLHLARTVPPGGEHDEQVRTWMSQVRLLAQDCNNCIDLYLYRGNPDIHLAKGGLWRYLLWVPWFLQKMVAQHRAAIQLRELKERARDVGKRRLRYGVEVPAKAVGQSPPGTGPTAAATPLSSVEAAAAPAAGDNEDEDGDHQLVVATATHHSGPRGALFGLRVPEDYFNEKLADWIANTGTTGSIMPSIAIVAPNAKDAGALANEALAVAKTHSQRCVLVDIPAVHYYFVRLDPEDILRYIWRELDIQLAKSQSQQEGTSQGEGEKLHLHWRSKGKRGIYDERWAAIQAIRINIQEMKVYEKFEKIKSEIQQVKRGQLQLKPELKQVQQKIAKESLCVLLLLLRNSAAAAADEQDQVRKQAKPTLSAWYGHIIKKTAKKLKEHMEEEQEEEEEEEKDEEEEEDDDEEEEKDKEEEEEEEKKEAAAKKKAPICLNYAQYKRILREVFPKTSNSNQEQDRSAANKDEARKTTITTSTTTLGEDQIKEMICRAKQEILETTTSAEDQIKEMVRKAKQEILETTTSTEDQIKVMIRRAKQDILPELQKDKSDKEQATGEPGGLVPNPEALIKAPNEKFKNILDQIPKMVIEDTIEKIETIQWRIQELMKKKGIVDKIQNHLKDARTLIILKTDENNELGWEETRNALSLLGCVAGAVIVIASKNTQQAKEYCNPLREPLDCSLVGFYHDIVLELTGHQMHEDNSQIFRGILDECKSHEFCMKIFAHALSANPKMSKEELSKLHSTLQEASPKSLDIIAMKMLKFSYNNLRKEYKSCLLYLAIFPQGHKIRRSTLIGRWVVEGLVTTDDWRWSSSVRKAERCFDTLIHRWLVYPADIGDTGKVKSCRVDKLVHEFITKIAKKQHTVETRLSRHLARHFSIFNDLHLRASDTIHKFFKMILPESSQVSQLKVLDLEGCRCFKKNRHYLKDICNKILLLKYLSLRGTDVTHLPREISNLHELEVLDIRQTEVPASATRNVMLLKLKRLLAGHIDPSPSMAIGAKEFSSVLIPEKIEKMVNMEVLSNVKALTSKNLKDISKLWQLRKLGVVIDDKNSHFSNLFRTISDLHECLRSLSITLTTTRFVGTPSIREFPDGVRSHLKHSPKLLESLSISGSTEKGLFLPLLAKDDGGSQLNKVTLTSTRLNQNDLWILAKLPKLCCVRLQHIECTERNLTFKKDEFQNLKYFLAEGSNFTEITFENEAAPELEKIVLSLTDNLKSLFGVENLPRLEEIELKNNSRLLSFFGKAKQIAKVTLTQGELQILTTKPSMPCIEPLEDSYDKSKLTFKESEFPKLNLLLVDCSVITNISFTEGSAPMLRKITWSFTNIESLSGIDKLSRLKELELIGDRVPHEVEEEIKKHEDRYNCKHRKPENQDQATGNELEEDDDARLPLLCWKNNKV
ncbi:uncharacterized protein LOC133928345 [Phragmites australis]|uniref:uncharacterized protein LOC133928345 n=1 Tax=Phragmites australis TaxID=29695 RepID=UPI002D76D0F6|nr:uncharacterized protein LOC133928345 [Phragmites australis]